MSTSETRLDLYSIYGETGEVEYAVITHLPTGTRVSTEANKPNDELEAELNIRLSRMLYLVDRQEPVA